jgi:hypothetical protein
MLHKADITVTITDAGGNTWPVTLRKLFRIYGDHTSHLHHRQASAAFSWDTYVASDQGMWMAIVDLTDPDTGIAPPLVVGNAKISVSAPGSLYDTYPGYYSNTGNLSNIPIEILAGTGALNPMNSTTGFPYQDVLGSMEPGPYVEVTFDGDPAVEVGGGSFTLRYVNSSFVNNDKPRVTTTTDDPNMHLAMHRIDQGDGTTLLKVMVSNPKGFQLTYNRNGLSNGKSLLRSLRFGITWMSPNAFVTDDNWQDTLQLVSAEYIDVNGNPLPELTPVMTKLN